MDQQNCKLEIDQTVGRDVRDEDFHSIATVLEEWCHNCDNILSHIEQQMTKANRIKEESKTAKQNFENKVMAERKKFSENEDVNMNEIHVSFKESNEKYVRRNLNISKLMKGKQRNLWKIDHTNGK